MREKLIKVLDVIGSCNAKYCCDCEFAEDIEGCVRRQKEIIADHLIANDVVPVVRCKDCVWCEKGKSYQPYCNHPTDGMHDVQLDDFCSYGERRTDGNDN